MAGDRLRRSRRARGGLGFMLAQERHRRGFSLLPWPPYKAPTPSSLFFLRPQFFSTLPIISGEPSSSNQCLCRCSKASISSALSLRAQPTHQFSLISLGTATRRVSSPRPVVPPSSPRRRGQRATVSLYHCRVLLRLRRNDVVLCDPLISHFDHHSYRSIAVIEDRSAVTAVNVDPCHRSLSGLVLCSNVFVVSY
jgi:hypothetical protein